LICGQLLPTIWFDLPFTVWNGEYPGFGIKELLFARSAHPSAQLENCTILCEERLQFLSTIGIKK
jgi:hypothetical protein